MVQLHAELERILISETDIQSRVKELAKQISLDFKDVERLYIIGILKGAFIFLADLTRQLSIPHVVDFMAVSSYGRTSVSGAVRILMDLRESIEGETVLIVEDIVDTGDTLHYLQDILLSRRPASIHTCVFAQKERSKTAEVQVDYLGFKIPDVWVVGYGLDFADRYRSLPYLAELSQQAQMK
jgi:hypoxanthine phosphoribosyltransferase